MGNTVMTPNKSFNQRTRTWRSRETINPKRYSPTTTTFSSLPGPNAITDLYLLALAVSQHGQFATLDTRIDPSNVPGGPQAYTLIS